ncbi:MAG: outer membrane protein assembly factor BamA [Bacteroidia bacterium]|jgi:outer membrane protein assembly factor BamA
MRVLLPILFIISSITAAVGQDTTSLYQVTSIAFEGNKITKESILYREMTLEVGEQFTLSVLNRKLERSRNNIRNLNIFNSVYVDTCIFENTVQVVIRLMERWYVIPIPIIEYADRNLGEWVAQGWKVDRLDYGLDVWWSNFRGRNETLFLLAQFGYNNSFGFKYRIPYLDKEKKFGIDLEFYFTRNHEIAYGVENSTRVFYKDPDRFVQVKYFGAAGLIVRPKLYNTHFIRLEYTDASIADTVAQLNPQYFNPDQSSTRYFALSYRMERDKRDYNVYPLKGYHFEVELRKEGLRIFKTAVDMLDVSAEFTKFWQLHNRWYLAGGLKFKASPFSTQAYYTQRGLGYETDFARGYELYVIDGQYYGLAKTNIRFQPVKDRMINLKFIKNKKVGLIPLSVFTSFHVDAGYVVDNIFRAGNPLANRFIVGAGVGVDLVTFYDVAWRLEYSMNDRLDHGFFIHFTKHI